MRHTEIAHCAHAVSLLCFDTHNPAAASIRGVHETLLNQIIRRQNLVANAKGGSSQKTKKNGSWLTSQYGHNQIQMFAHYAVAAYRVLDADSRVPKEVLQSVEVNLQTARVSDLQNRVTAALRTALLALATNPRDAFTVQAEYCHFGGVLPVDVAIIQHNQVVALLEVDGPQHYRRDGCLTRKSQFKQSLYKRTLPNALFTRIAWKDVKQYGVETLVKYFVEELQKDRSGSPWLRRWRGFKRGARSFVQWILRNSQFDEYKHF